MGASFTAGNYWFEALEPYVKNTQILACPSRSGRLPDSQCYTASDPNVAAGRSYADAYPALNKAGTISYTHGSFDRPTQAAEPRNPSRHFADRLP